VRLGTVLIGTVPTTKESAVPIRRIDLVAPASPQLDNFQIQNLMSAFNQAETLASSVQKKQDDVASSTIGKI
jgi:hypothetical protein